MKAIHKLTVALLSVVAVSTNTTFATTQLTIDVEGADSASHSANTTVGILNKTNGGKVTLSGTNAIGNLDIQGGKVSVSSASNLNGTSSAVTFDASGTDPVTGVSNTATLEIAGSMNTGALAFTSAGTVQVDGSNVATLSAAPTGTGLAHKTGTGMLKVASDLSASKTLMGINVDAGTFYVQSGTAPVAPIAVANGAIVELGAELAPGAVGGAVTVASGAEMLVDSGARVPNQADTKNTTVTYTFDGESGYYKTATGNLLPGKLTGLYGYYPPFSRHYWYTGQVGGVIPKYTYGNPLEWSGTVNGFLAPAEGTTYQDTKVVISEDIFTGGIQFAPDSILKLSNGSNWGRNITVGTAS